MRYLSVCSGIEAATSAWHPIGWQPFAFSEIEPFPCSVLSQHYPSVPNLGDMTKYKEWPDAAIDVLVGGTPCQSFSVAGLRKGLGDPRGNLMLTYGAIAAKYRPKWLVWENVPGVLSSNGGRDFGTFLGMLGELGYGYAYRVLDAQYFGVAQRRRRVFVVGYLGDWRRAAAVLFERASLSGNPAPRREAGEVVAPTLAAGANGGGPNGPGRDVDTVESLQVQPYPVNIYGGNKRADRPAGGFYVKQEEVSKALDAASGLNPTCSQGGTAVMQPRAFTQNQRNEVRELAVAGALAAEPGMKQQTYVAFYPTQDPIHSSDGTVHAMGCRSKGGCATPAVVWSIMPQNSGRDYKARQVDVMQPLMAGGVQHGNQGGDIIQTAMQVRRLTPRECERLQGFPDDYTLITHRGKPAADGPRYKALGNSMAVPVMNWIGRSLDAALWTESL